MLILTMTKNNAQNKDNKKCLKNRIYANDYS